MTVLTSQISTTSETFTANTKRMQALVDDIQAKAKLVIKGGTDEARERHTSRGKLLPRDRLAQLLDAGSPFLEIGQFAAWDMYDDTISSAGLIAGIGRVSGKEVMIVINDATVKGGTYYPLTVKKHLRAQEIACRTICPASISWIPVAQIFPIRTKSFRIANILAVSSTTRQTCRRRASRRSRWSWDHARRAAPMCPPCRKKPSWSKARQRFFLPALPWSKQRQAKRFRQKTLAVRKCIHASRALPTTTPWMTRTRLPLPGVSLET